MTESPRPLSSVRVLDLTRLLPGPLGSLVLADLGATVDKLEDPGAGDYMRLAPPSVDGQGIAYWGLNRGKRSLVLDLKHAEGALAFKRLVRSYDVVFEQFRPGVLERLGAGHDALLAENPRLVICALTGYGQTGPLSSRAGHDLNYLARSGVLGLQGPEEAPPQPPAFQLADVSGGMWSVIAILAALRERDQTGRGKVLDVSMMESVVPFAVATFAGLLGGEAPRRGGETLTGGIAPYNTYATEDGKYVTLGALEPKFLSRFCANTGLQFDARALVPGPHQAQMKAEYARVFASRTRAEWEAFNEEHDCCIEPVLEPGEILEDAHFVARKIVLDERTPTSHVLQLKTPVTPDDLDATPAPKPGENTDEILSEAGFSEAEIRALKANGAVQ